MRITIIIPVRVGEALYEGVSRLQKILETVPHEHFDILVVDYGSPPKESASVQEAVRDYPNASAIRVDAETLPFSAGIARNIGAQNARTPVIMFHDVDCLASREMYLRIHAEAECREIDNNAYDFFAVPVAFLTFEGTEEYLRLLGQSRAHVADAQFHYHIIRGEKQFIWFMGYSGSTIVVNRMHYLAIGGTSAEFHGHGAEDYEVKLRLAAYRPIGKKPLDFYRNTKNNQMADYVGFRSYLSLYGYEVAFRGIYMAHLWHPRREVNRTGKAGNIVPYRQTERNFTIMTEMMKAFEASGAQPSPLQDLSSDRKTLVLCRPNSSALETLRQALPLMGRYVVMDENVFESGEALVHKVRDDGYTHVLFLNPYGNEHRLSLYHAARRADIPYWVHDRGALPHSWFFDPCGFNADSSSYDRDNWDTPLSAEEEQNVVSYIQAIKASAETLEKNGAPKSADYWRSSLGIGDRRVLFVPLQRPRDTVTRYFGGAVGPYENFYYWVSRVAAELDSTQWAVVVKKHPAEQMRPNIPGVIFAPDDAHVHDMIDLAETVMLLNSGVGVLSLAFGKPVVACGEAFYTTAGLAAQAMSPEEAIEKIVTGTGFDDTTARRFIHFLSTSFYSFGATTYVERQNAGETFLAATRIIYRSIRMLTDTPVVMGSPPREASLDSPLFSTFGGKDAIERARTKLTTTPEKPAITAKPVSPLRRPLVPIVRPFVVGMGTKKDVEKFNADPAGFFAKLTNPRYRAIGSVLFPPSKPI